MNTRGAAVFFLTKPAVPILSLFKPVNSPLQHSQAFSFFPFFYWAGTEQIDLGHPVYVKNLLLEPGVEPRIS